MAGGFLEINYYDLINKKQIGKGHFGVVYVGRARSGPLARIGDFAIKEVKRHAHFDQDFRRELDIFKSVNGHRNVVKLLGYCIQPHICIIMEYVTITVDGKNISGLKNYLKHLRRRRCRLDHAELESFALQIAEGMQHLENRGIVHRDLRAVNVLINDTKTLKISDFGLARPNDFDPTNDNVFHPLWGAPEVHGQYHFTSKSDVWSYGIVLWEIATLGRRPYHPHGFLKGMKNSKRGIPPSRPSNVSQQFFNIMSSCWLYNPDERFSFTDIIWQLNNLRSSNIRYFLANVQIDYINEPDSD